MNDALAGSPPDGDPAADGNEVTRLLVGWREGSAAAQEQLFALIYEELHRIASARMRSENPAHTLQSTALVHEAYLRLVGSDVTWVDRGHFMAAAARTMRRVLTDHARGRDRGKRGGGGLDRVTLSGLGMEYDGPGDIDLLALSEALDELAAQDARKAAAVEMHYYAGLTYEEVAEAQGVSPATVYRDLRMARAWLKDRLS